MRVEGAFPLIGVGGIDSGEAALAKIRAGACLSSSTARWCSAGCGSIGDIKADLVGRAASRGPSTHRRTGRRDAAAMTAEQWPRRGSVDAANGPQFVGVHCTSPTILPERKALDVLHDDALQPLQRLRVAGFGPQRSSASGVASKLHTRPSLKGMWPFSERELHCEFMAPDVCRPAGGNGWPRRSGTLRLRLTASRFSSRSVQLNGTAYVSADCRESSPAAHCRPQFGNL